ncbi:MAG: NCS2 family permease [Planctomycetota bacterium]|jgi:AGZA family xanthine/uracil permease-like MFS transporter
MRWFVRRDIDGFFGLFVDNLVQLLLIVALCGGLCGMSGDEAHFLYVRILPGAAVSILLGNLFYAWQARRLARREGRDDVTALPYGINTPSLLVYVFFVMAPVYRETKSAEVAWQMGLLACLGSGIIELLGAFVAEGVRKHTPRAALLATLAGIAIGFISMPFMLHIFSSPLIALVPLGIVLITYFSGVRFPLGLPGGLVAIVAGTLLAWLLPSEWTGRGMALDAVQTASAQAGWYVPVWSAGGLSAVFQLPAEQWVRFISVILPMGLFNVIGSLQNIESAEAAGDRYDTGSSLAANGVGTIVAALFGSCFPTTIYIGHPGWKGLGARAGYSVLNGVVVTAICLTGTVALVNTVVPIEAGMAIVLWIGIIITAQAFTATPREHAPAVAIGLFPAIAAWGATVVIATFQEAGGATLQSMIEADIGAAVSGFVLHGLIVLEKGYIFTCMVLAAICACLIDRRFLWAAIWSLTGGAVTALGLCHAYRLVGNAADFLLVSATGSEGAILYRAPGIIVGYVLMAVVFIVMYVYARFTAR